MTERMKRVVGETAMVRRPTQKIELRISGLDEDTGSEEIRDIVMQETECEREEIKTETVRRNRFGEGSIWVQCPWHCAVNLAKLLSDWGKSG